MTVFKPEGLKLPDCLCFKVQAAKMNKSIDTVGSVIAAEVCLAAIEMNICPESKDYYFACLVSELLILLLNPDIRPSEQEKQFEENYNRLRPLIMQRLHYANDKFEEAGVKFK